MSESLAVRDLRVVSIFRVRGFNPLDRNVVQSIDGLDRVVGHEVQDPALARRGRAERA